MGSQKTNEELRAEVVAMDATKDVPIVAGITMAAVSGISAAAGVLACLAVGFLEQFRQDVSAYWMGCVPLIFPVITAVSAAYRKHLGNVGLHIGVCLLTLLTGGAGYGYCVEKVYVYRHDCVPVDELRYGSCDKEGLVYLYVISGGVACGFAVLGLLISFCTCSVATKRRDRRVHDQRIREEREAERKMKEIRQVQRQQSSQPRPSIKPSNGQEKPKVTNGATTTNQAAQDATTHL